MTTEEYILQKYGALLRLGQVAELMLICKARLSNYISENRYPSLKSEDRRGVYHYKDVAKALDQHRSGNE